MCSILQFLKNIWPFYRENKLSSISCEYVIPPSSNVSHDSINTDCEILTAFFEDNAKVVSNQAIIGAVFFHSKGGESPKGKTKLQRLKDLGLLGAIKDSEITSENYKKYLQDDFD